MADGTEGAWDAFHRLLVASRLGAGDRGWTHVTMHPHGKYRFRNDLDALLLCGRVLQEKATTTPERLIARTPLTLAERPGPYTPLRVDVDLKYGTPPATRRYSQATIRAVVAAYQAAIEAAIPPGNFNPWHVGCLVLEKPAPRVEVTPGGDRILKDGFHLHFPHFVCSAPTMEYLRARVLASGALRAPGLWEGGLTWEDAMLDTGIGTKTWLVYGSAKQAGQPAYAVSMVLGDHLREYDLPTLFRVSAPEEAVRENLPRLLSIRGGGEPTPLVPTAVADAKRYEVRPRRRAPPLTPSRRAPEEVVQDLALIREGRILRMLSAERAVEYATWMEVGWTLFCVAEGSEEGLAMWHAFSERSPAGNYDPDACDRAWDKMHCGGKTVASLLHMAKQDSPAEFREWKRAHADVKTRAVMSAGITDFDIAVVVAELLKDKFVCAGLRPHPQWYVFRGHRWRKCKSSLRSVLARDVVDYFEAYRRDLHRRILDAASEDDRKRFNEHIDHVERIIKKLKTSCAQNGILTQLADLMLDDTFLERANVDNRLIGCENGVIDLELGAFRPGRPDDAITYSTKVEFPDPTHLDQDAERELDGVLERIFPNPVVRQYILDAGSMTLSGANQHKLFLTCTGTGNNGKSVFFKLMELALGEYAIKFPTAMFTGREDASGSARPELARARGKRLAIIQEVAYDQKLNIGVLKEMTGNDTFYARSLYSEGGEVTPMFTLWMMCNELPSIPGDDQATWNRVRVLQCISTFKSQGVPVDPAEQRRRHIYPMDTTLGSRLHALAPLFLKRLTDNYATFQLKHALADPPEVLGATHAYRERNDQYAQFIKDRLEAVVHTAPKGEGEEKEGEERTSLSRGVPPPPPRGVPDTRARVRWNGTTGVYEEFKEWWRSTQAGRRLPTKAEAQAQFGKPDRLGPLVRERGRGGALVWFGWRRRVVSLEEDDGGGPGEPDPSAA